jgi:hypothetical protein
MLKRAGSEMTLPLFVEHFFRKSLSHLLILEQRLVGGVLIPLSEDNFL